jgi:predicted TIM-barrel fold metal-dependent hydrolase
MAQRQKGKGMIYDIHAHAAGMISGQNGNYLCPRNRMNLPLRILLKRMHQLIPRETAASVDEEINRMTRSWIAESKVDCVVLLALDGVYDRNGRQELERTQIIVSNDFVAEMADGDTKLLFGASIHPFRKDALEELDRVVQRGACLIKWLPSTQNIPPDDPLCFPFYERMAHHGIPLLSHTGIEHTLREFDDSLNDPARLTKALEREVTVIAAHCGTRMFLHEQSYFKQWVRMAKEHENFYGDLSAFCLPIHGGPLQRILNDSELLSKVLYGSDFPLSAMPMWYAHRLGWRQAMRMRKMANPFDKTLLMMQELGTPDKVFSRAEKLLRLPKGREISEGGTL